MLRKRLSTTGTSNWIVQKLIERDHINHHYRRLNGARSQLQLNATSPSTRRSSGHHRQLSKSNLDLRPVRFEDDLRSLERQMSSQFSLDVVLPEDKRKKKELFDQSLDVINKHSKYFSPTKEFTPRLVRKIVRPTTSSRLPCSRPITPGSLRRPKLDTSLPSPQQRPMKAVYFPDDLVHNRNVSDDSAFGDGHDSSSDQSSSNISDDLEAFNFTNWLKEQEEENCYTKLMCDITGDLLQRHLCTNGHMKEIIAVYIRKSRRKFTVGANVLMKRLCDDLLIPTDESYDNRYYGSYRRAVEYYPSDQNILKEIQPAPRSSNEGEYSSPQHRLRKEMEDMTPRNQRQLSMKSPEPLELIRPIDVGYQTEREDDASVHQDVLSHHLANSSNKVEIDLGNIPAEVDGYCSDFTNDTDNDIEEEFDFD